MISEELRNSLLLERSSHWEEYFSKWSNAPDDGEEIVYSKELALCDKCHIQTNVPNIFQWKNFSCDFCLISASGHKNCQTPSCPKCIQLGTIISKRKALVKAFEDGDLTMDMPRGFFISYKERSTS